MSFSCYCFAAEHQDIFPRSAGMYYHADGEGKSLVTRSHITACPVCLRAFVLQRDP